MSVVKYSDGKEIVTSAGRAATYCGEPFCTAYCTSYRLWSSTISHVIACPDYTFNYNGFFESEINGTWVLSPFTPFTPPSDCIWRLKIGQAKKTSSGEIRDLWLYYKFLIPVFPFTLPFGDFTVFAKNAVGFTPSGWIFFKSDGRSLGDYYYLVTCDGDYTFLNAHDRYCTNPGTGLPIGCRCATIAGDWQGFGGEVFLQAL